MHRQPENIGEVLFESLGAGLQAFGPLMQQEKENNLRQLQFEMQRERFEQQKELTATRLDFANLQLQDALKRSNETPEDRTVRKEQEARDEAQAEIAGLETLLRPLVPDPMSGILESAETAGVRPNVLELGSIIEQQTGRPIDFKFSGLNIGQPEQQSPFDINALSDFAETNNLEIDDVKINADGSIDFLSLGRPRVERFSKNKVLYQAVGSDPQRFLDLIFGRGEFQEAEGLGALNDFIRDQLGDKRFTQFITKTGEFAKNKTRLQYIENLFGEGGIRQELDPFALTQPEIKQGRNQKERALVNAVFDRMKGINPEAFNKIEDLGNASDEQVLQRFAESDDFITKTPVEDTGFDLPFFGNIGGEETRQVDPELQKRINALRSFREGRTDIEFPSDEHIAARPTQEPTPRQEAINWLSSFVKEYSQETEADQEAAIRTYTDFLVTRGRPPEDFNELRDFTLGKLGAQP